MVQFAFKYFRANPLPVITAIGQVQVPCLIHRIRRRNLMPRAHRQPAEAAVFLDYAGGMHLTPPVFAGETLLEGEISIGGANAIDRQALPERIVG
ncbi:hypothetical protein [Croceicoccus naphthovorans]|uniref:hypothetical protein n=1 Tax=Croceicoccus naphthovorans TaxID=1348774 RepID=UPI000A6A4AF2|nr:hypothetical protein [Croceicoccus naphthovorans]MBB3988784.1 hypothetical protein [Croceicoccus naphthovorans]